MVTHIREATIDDAAALALLATQLGYPSQPEGALRRLTALDPGNNAVLVAEHGTQVVGFIHVLIKPSVLVERSAEIGALVVEQRWRGKGIGAALLRAAEDWATSQDCSCLCVRTNVVRKGAHAFYRRAGYERSKTSFVFTKRLDTPQ
jgi:GNAT superfamily N-acetyltransferase